MVGEWVCPVAVILGSYPLKISGKHRKEMVSGSFLCTCMPACTLQLLEDLALSGSPVNFLLNEFREEYKGFHSLGRNRRVH